MVNVPELGAYDMHSASKTAVWLFCLTWYAWPLRYYFYYRFVSCGPSDVVPCPTGATSPALDIPISGITAPSCGAVDALFASNNVFYVNMLGQAALLMVCCNVAYLIATLKALDVSGVKDIQQALPNQFNNGMSCDTLGA
jgi:hypothetical protein